MKSLLANYGGGGESKKREQSGGVDEESGVKKAKAVTSDPPVRHAAPPPPQRSSRGFDSSDEEDQGEDEFEPKKQLKTGPASRQPAQAGGSGGKASTMFVPPQVRSGRPNKVTEDSFK
jgi:hypothetical protein